MYISTSHNLIYLPAPRTASRAVGQYLVEHNFKQVNGHHNFTDLRQKKYKSFATFTIIRNHWDTWISWYASTGASVEHAAKLLLPFIRTKIKLSQQWMLPHKLWGVYTPISNHILHYEKLEYELSILLGHAVKLPTVGKSDRVGHHAYYTQESWDWVYNNYQEEIEELGYGIYKEWR